MSWLLFDERGERAQKLFCGVGGVTPGWIAAADSELGANVFGFIPDRDWFPRYFAVKMSKGWRVFTTDYPTVQYVDQTLLTELWRCASPDHKRLPHIAAVEVWIRHKAERI